ncbi:MAG: hypothetical protein HY930_00730 [Euryarchaeota archaeon]|nr:hypothetical protein [Euryarchaeota archaeon]
MKTASVLKDLEKRIMFDMNAVRGIIKKDVPYTRLFLHRLRKSGNVFQIERNKYTVHKDAFLIASRIVWPSYISMWSAIRFYNLTEQIPQSVWVVTARKKRRKEISFSNTKIVFVLTKPKYFFGFKKIDFRGFEIFIAEPEKSIIDGLLFRKISVSEIFSILKSNLRTLNISRLLAYAIKTGNKALIKRLGFLLDKLGFDYRDKLRKYIYHPYTPLEYNLPPRGKFNDKWRIIENVKV